ncbi:MAG: C40 family peptidase [Lachnospiraceae bacterium]|nr:C40 family peptidase [Lachnospiraceae bacterium]
MKRFLRYTAFILAAVLAAGTVQTGAVSFDDLDAKTAVAGASYALENFLYTYEDAEEQLNGYLNREEPESESEAETEPEEDPEALVLYEEAKIGKVAFGSVLNVRKEADVSADIIGGAILGQELTIVGEQTVGGILWYYLQLTDYHGFVAGDFIEVLEGSVPEETEAVEPSVQPTEPADQPAVQPTEAVQPQNDVTVLPENFELGFDAGQAGSDVFEELTYHRNEINYCLKNELPKRQEAEEWTNVYSVLVYILEEYQEIAEISADYGMHDTFLRATRDMEKIEYAREALSARTGMTEHDFYEEIRQNNEAARAAAEEAARQQAAAEEAARQAAEAEAAAAAAAQAEADVAAQAAAQAAAEEAARQAEEAARQAAEAAAAAAAAAQQSWEEQLAAARAVGEGTLGREIADLAATYVGWLPYVWGGASLTNGADCSGFVSQIMAAKGLLDQGRANTHGYDSGSLRSVGYGVAMENIMPGDIVCYSGHVAIYFGNGIVVHEPAPGRFAEYGNVHMLGIVCIRRLY